MPTSQTFFLSEILDNRAIIPEGKLAYFRERLSNRLYDVIVGAFLEKETNNELTRSELSRRIGKSREQITRWLSSPGNWTLDTLSDLILGICGGELLFSIKPFGEMSPRNSTPLDLLEDAPVTLLQASNNTSAVRTTVIKTEHSNV